MYKRPLKEIPAECSRPKAFVVGISGPSCSGKTTITRILRNVLAAEAIVIYQDDFYKPEKNIPVDPVTGLQNWDSPDAVDYVRMYETIEHVRCYREFSGDYHSAEENNTHDGSDRLDPIVSRQLTETLLSLKDWALTNNRFIVIVDGFMLFHKESISELIDLKVWLTCSFETMKERRGERSGYITQEGYWQDPPYYFEKIVWPEYRLMYQHYVKCLGNDNTVLRIDTTAKDINEMAREAVAYLYRHTVETADA